MRGATSRTGIGFQQVIVVRFGDVIMIGVMMLIRMSGRILACVAEVARARCQRASHARRRIAFRSLVGSRIQIQRDGGGSLDHWRGLRGAVGGRVAIRSRLLIGRLARNAHRASLRNGRERLLVDKHRIRPFLLRVRARHERLVSKPVQRQKDRSEI